MEKATGKEVEHSWDLPLTIDLIQHIKKVGVIPLGGSRTIHSKLKGGELEKRGA